MALRRFGNDNLFPLCLGGNVFGWTADLAGSFDILDAFVAGGGTMVDTADVYSAWAPGHAGGESESILGQWMAERANRQSVIIATKVCQLATRPGLSPANIAGAVADSLQRLRTDYIDLYYAHRPDPDTPIVDTLAAFDALIKDGTIRHYGLSNFTGSQIGEACSLAAANGLAAPSAIQPRYNLVDRADFETDLARVVLDQQLAVFPYYGLAAGFLTGKYAPGEAATGARGGSVTRYCDPARFAVVDAAAEIADAHGCATATVALAWLLTRPAVTAPIASASRADQLPALLQAATLQLTESEIALLDQLSDNLPPANFS